MIQREPAPYEQTVFFTDRSLYRPGQTIQYKGICIRVDQAGTTTRRSPTSALTVIFQGPNGKEIARQQLKANDYGSFSGSFTAPRDRLMGQMTPPVDGGPAGSDDVQRRGVQAAEVPGDARGAEDSGQAEREGQPAGQGDGLHRRGRRRRQGPLARGPRGALSRLVVLVLLVASAGPEPSQEIAHGTAATADRRHASPSSSSPSPTCRSPEKDEPTFHFTVYADVTDTTGETRSASSDRSTSATRPCKATLTAAEWQTDGEAGRDHRRHARRSTAKARRPTGTLKVYALKQPEKVQRRELGFAAISRHAARRRVDAGGAAADKPDPSNPNSWELGEVVGEQGFTTDGNGQVKVSVKLSRRRLSRDAGDAGPLRQEGHRAAAASGRSTRRPSSSPIKVPNHSRPRKWTLEPGEEFMALWGTGYDKGRAFIEIEHRRKMLQSFWTAADRTQQVIKQAVTEAMRGGFTCA